MLNEKDMNQLVDELCRINGTDTSYYLRLDTESKEDIELLNIISVSVHVKMMVNYLLGESNYNISVYDLYKMQYKGRDANALENYRLEGLKRIAEEPDPLKKVSIFYDYARELKNSINILSIMDYITKNTRTLVYLEVCLNMIKSGNYSLGDIKSIMPWLDISDIYGVAKMIGKEILATEEEMEEILKECDKSKKPNTLGEVLKETNNMA